jgi:hypothetical protein
LDVLIGLEGHVRDLDTIYEGAIRGAEVAQPHSAIRENNFAVRTRDRWIIDGEVVTFAAAKFVDTLPEQKRSRLGRARVDNQSRHNIWLDERSMHLGRAFARLLCPGQAFL